MFMSPVVSDDGSVHGYDHFVGEWWNAGNLADREVGQYFDVYWAPNPFWCKEEGDDWVPRGKAFHDWVHDRWYWPGTQEQRPYGPWWGSGKGATPPPADSFASVGKGKTSAEGGEGMKGTGGKGKKGKDAVDDYGKGKKGKGEKGKKATDGKGCKGKKGKDGGDGKGKGKDAASS